MIQQTILFNGFISALPQKEAMMAEPEQERKRTRRTSCHQTVSQQVEFVADDRLGVARAAETRSY